MIFMFLYLFCISSSLSNELISDGEWLFYYLLWFISSGKVILWNTRNKSKSSTNKVFEVMMFQFFYFCFVLGLNFMWNLYSPWCEVNVLEICLIEILVVKIIKNWTWIVIELILKQVLDLDLWNKFQNIEISNRCNLY